MTQGVVPKTGTEHVRYAGHSVYANSPWMSCVYRVRMVHEG